MNLKIPKKLNFFKKFIIFDVECFLSKPNFKKLIKHSPYLIVAKFCRTHRDRGYFKNYQQRLDKNFLNTFGDDVIKYMNKSRNMTLIAHNTIYDFITSGIYYPLIASGYKVTTFSDSNPFFIIFQKKYEYGEGVSTITILDNMNYYRTSLAKIGEFLNLKKWDDFDYNDTSEENKIRAVDYCRNDVEIVHRGLLHLWKFIEENFGYNCLGGKGNFITISSLTYKIFMLQYTPSIEQSSEFNINLERNAYIGGRCEIFKMGISNFQIYIDINSLYPYIMKNCKIPYCYLNQNLELNLENLEKYSCVAKVEIYDLPNEKRFCGVRYKEKLIFPEGTFTAYLSTPELKYLLEQKIKFRIYSCVWYENTYLFEEYINLMHNKRKNSANNMEKTLLKLFMNSLYGKFGQKLKTNEIVEETDELGSFYELDEEKRYVKCFGGNKFIEKISDISGNTAVYIAAHITAYARMYLWDFIEKIGIENIAYCDTDSIVCGNECIWKINEYIDNKKLGFFKIEHENINFNARGLKDYEITGENEYKEKLKGVPKKYKKIDENTYEIQNWNKLNYYIKNKQFNQYYSQIIIKKLTREYTKGVVQSNNEVIGIHMKEGG